MMAMRYTYRDIASGKTRWTAGRFTGWSAPTGPLGVRYAGFQRRSGTLYVPEYLLTQETKEELRMQGAR